jgi:sec-independent protein translocase protein TatA
MADVGPMELLIILAIVVVLFGASRIGDIGKGLGRGIREFRHELHEAKEEEPPTPSGAVTTGTTTATVTISEPKRPQAH